MSEQNLPLGDGLFIHATTSHALDWLLWYLTNPDIVDKMDTDLAIAFVKAIQRERAAEAARPPRDEGVSDG